MAAAPTPWEERRKPATTDALEKRQAVAPAHQLEEGSSLAEPSSAARAHGRKPSPRQGLSDSP